MSCRTRVIAKLDLHFDVSYMFVKFHDCILQNETGESKPKEPQQEHTQINLSALNMITVAIRGAEEWKGRDI